MQDFSLKTPVALVMFNRPDCVRKSFTAIREAKPRELFIIADGPRQGFPDDIRLCAECRDIVDNIDWECKVHRNYSDVNLGCGQRPSTGFSWVFDQVDTAILLEDDCIPSSSFFRFCQELLEKYYDDEHVDSVAGCNFGITSANGADYYFSHAFNSWGWASWRRVWKRYDYEIKKWPKIKKTSALRDAYMVPAFVKHWEEAFDRVYAKQIISAWDYQADFMSLAHGGVHIYPQKNLISYIGFDESATHTLEADENNRLYAFTKAAYEIEFPLRHPQSVAADFRADYLQMTDIQGISPSSSRFIKDIPEEKLNIIKQYNKILVYGAGTVAREVICLLGAEKIDCFSVAVTHPEQNRLYIMGNRVRPLDDFLDFREDGIILVSADRNHSREMGDILKQKGFQNILYMVE